MSNNQNMSDEVSEHEELSNDEIVEEPIIKKEKETFENIMKQIKDEIDFIKQSNKDISELDKHLKLKEKDKHEHTKKMNNLLKTLEKAHADEIVKAMKKPKRKGNVNGGFNKEHPVPEILRVFLGLPENVAMSRPKVMSALSNKFKDLKLKNGQNTVLDKTTAEQLNIPNGDGKLIKFGEFQLFLSSFYNNKIIVNV
jgi:hypothetical protein